MTEYKNTPEKPNSDPRDREPADEAPATPTDEPRPVPVQDPPVSEPRAPYTVTKEDIVACSPVLDLDALQCESRSARGRLTGISRAL